MILPIMAAVFYSLVAFIENYLTDKHFKRKEPDSLTMFSVIGCLVSMTVILAIKQTDVFVDLDMKAVVAIMICGAINIAATVPYYRAFAYGEATEITILGQFMPVISLFLALMFLGDKISPVQIVAFIVIFGATMLIASSLGDRKKRLVWNKKAVLYMLLACFGWSVSDVLFAHFAWTSSSDLIGAAMVSFFWFQAGVFVAIHVIYAITKDWQDEIGSFLKKGLIPKMSMITLSELFFVLAEFAFRMGLVVMPVAIMSVTEGVMRLVVTFILGIILTKVWPLFGREKMTRNAILRHVVAIILAIIGIVLIEWG
jgi:Predicted membrane protein